MVLLDVCDRGRERGLHQPVAWHALQRHLCHHTQRAEPDLGEAEQLRLVLPGQLDRPKRGRHHLERHNCVVRRRDRCARAVRAHLCETAYLLLTDRCVVLQRETKRLQVIGQLLHAHARLHRNLLLVSVHTDHLVQQPHRQHAIAAEAQAVGRQRRAGRTQTLLRAVCCAHKGLHIGRRLGMEPARRRDLVRRRPICHRLLIGLPSRR
mmetsp:Transcript_20063/g.59579  ORF Transcript_20063/g.59579 Transcript_20063/m.59579 type:complete len:208 (-) Transcript_20063:297-920(-)